MRKSTSALVVIVLVILSGLLVIPRREHPSRAISGSKLSPPVTPTPRQAVTDTSTSEWAVRYAAAATPAARAELVQARRERMKELIRTDPERALAEALPFAARQSLPAAVQAQLEQPISGRGFYGVLVANDFENRRAAVRREVVLDGRRYQAFVYGRRLAQTTKQNIPLSGIALDGLVALDENPVRAVSPAEAQFAMQQLAASGAPPTCPISNVPTAVSAETTVVAVGSEFHFLCRAAHLNQLQEQMIAQEDKLGPFAAGEPPHAQDSWTQGLKTVLLIRVTYADNPGAEPQSFTSVNSALDSCNSFFIENSWGTFSWVGTVTPLLVLPQSEQWYKDNGDYVLYSDALAAAAAAGYDYENYTLEAVRFSGGPGSYGGQAYVGSRGCWLKSSSSGTYIHEFGHNLGLWHANAWVATNDSIIGPGSNDEYGDNLDTMGPSNGGDYHFNAMHRNKLDWLPDSYVETITTNGTYRLFAFDVPVPVSDRKYALKIRKDLHRDYWLNVRQSFVNNRWLLNGVELHWAPWTSSNLGTHLLDTTPGSTPNNSDASVFIGRTFSDWGAGLHLTPVAKTGSGTELGMDVVVNLGQFPGNHAPTVSLTANQTSVATGTAILLSATATDADGDTLAYAWDFGDNTYGSNSVNAASLTYQWPNAGEYAVQCAVTDMKGQVGRATVVITVGNPTTRRITGQILDEANQPVAGVRLTTGGVTAGFTDSAGAYVIANLAAGTHTLAAVKNGFTLAPLGGWANPVDVTAGTVAGIDFLATALPGVSVAVVDGFASEAGSDPATVRIARTGPTTAPLNVKVRPFGTAFISSDYSTTPPLSGGVPYTVTIPTGAAFTDIVITPVNDAVSEGNDTVTFTIWEDPAYLIAGPASATVVLEDDDAYSVPAVSIIASTSSGDNLATESNNDSGAFLFQRFGNTASNLVVQFTVGGTATPGEDYTPLPASVVIPTGQTQVLLPLSVRDDVVVEGNETTTLTLIASPAYTPAASSATITIVDDDPPQVTLTVTDADMSEPSNGATFRVVRAGNLAGNLVVKYALSGTASNGVDYTTPTGTVTISAGNSGASITIAARDDTEVEGDETVTVNLLPATSYNVGDPASHTVILKDNELPTVTLATPDTSAAEAGGGTNTASFTITRTTPTTGDLPVYYSLAGTAVNGADYVLLSGVAIVPDGATVVTNVVTAIDDAWKEATEQVRLTLLPAAAYNLGATTTGSINITDNDSAGPITVEFTLATSSLAENGAYKPISVSFSAAPAGSVSVNYTVTGGTATGGGVDHSLNNGTLANSGDLTRTLNLGVINDSVAEPNETVLLTLDTPVGVVLGGRTTHEFTILDDDRNTLTVTATGLAATEAGPVAGNFRISRTGSTTEPVTVQLHVLGTAANGVDYEFIATTATIPAGSSFLDLPVTPVDDLTDEVDETVVAQLLAAPGQGYKIGSPTTASVTLTDNDDNSAFPVITVEAPDAIATEAAVVTDTGLLTIARGTNTTGNLVVFYSVGGSATSGSDFTSLGTSATISNGQTSISLPVRPTNNSTAEAAETVIVTLTATDGYYVGTPAAATVTILDDDVVNVSVIASVPTAAEDGSSAGEFTFTRTGTTNTALTVNFLLTGTASNGVDYAALASPITIPAGTNGVQLLVPGLADAAVEGAETVRVTLLAGAGYNVVDPSSALVSILDDAVTELPIVTIATTQSPAREWGQAAGEFTLTRTGNTNQAVAVQFVVTGSASNGVDYASVMAPVIIPAGAVSAPIPINPLPDTHAEGPESVTITLTAVPEYTLGAATAAVLTIHDLPADAWRQARFTAAELLDETSSGDLADPDRDGAVNLLEYAFGLDPHVPDRNGLPQPSLTNGHLTLTYTRVVAAVDLTYIVEVADQPGIWQSGEEFTEDVSIINHGDTETVQTRDKTPANSAFRRFIRLKVIRTP